MDGIDRLLAARLAAYVAAVAAALAFVTGFLYDVLGGSLQMLNDLSILVATGALAPLMLGYYQLGGRTPIVPARIALTAAVASVLVWTLVQAAMLLGLLQFYWYASGPNLPLTVLELARVVIGGWLIGASLLAGPWLRPVARWLGVLVGLGFVLFGGGILLGRAYSDLVATVSLGYQVLMPAWAYLVGGDVAHQLARVRGDLERPVDRRVLLTALAIGIAGGAIAVLAQSAGRYAAEIAGSVATLTALVAWRTTALRAWGAPIALDAPIAGPDPTTRVRRAVSAAVGTAGRAGFFGLIGGFAGTWTAYVVFLGASGAAANAVLGAAVGGVILSVGVGAVFALLWAILWLASRRVRPVR